MKKFNKNSKKRKGYNKKSFAKTATKVNRKNGMPRSQPAMRGGIRL